MLHLPSRAWRGAGEQPRHLTTLFFFAIIVSLFGDWFNLIASAALISTLTKSGFAVGGLFVVRMLAPFLASPIAGVAEEEEPPASVKGAEAGPAAGN